MSKWKRDKSCTISFATSCDASRSYRTVVRTGKTAALSDSRLSAEVSTKAGIARLAITLSPRQILLLNLLAQPDSHQPHLRVSELRLRRRSRFDFPTPPRLFTSSFRQQRDASLYAPIIAQCSLVLLSHLDQPSRFELGRSAGQICPVAAEE